MKMRSTGRISLRMARNVLFAAAALSAGANSLAQAQNYDRPPADVPGGGYEQRGGDTSTMLRVDRLENQVRSLNGQVEQLQFQAKRLEDQLRKFQIDVDQRLAGCFRAGTLSIPPPRGKAFRSARSRTRRRAAAGGAKPAAGSASGDASRPQWPPARRF